MDPQKPDPHYDPYDRLDLSDTHIEEDTIAPVTRIRHTRRGLPAAVSFAVVGIMVVAGMAFGANVVLPMVGAKATPVVVPDETEPPAVAEATATVEPTEAAQPTDEPVVEPTEAAQPTDGPVVEPTKEPTAKPTEKPASTAHPTEKPDPTAKPTPAGPVNLGAITVVNKGGGCYEFSWKAYTGRDFSYWKLVHGDWGTQPYYPAFPYWAVIDPGTTSWYGCVDPGDYAVRVQAIYYPNGEAKAAAQTAILHLTVSDTAPVPPTVNLGNLTVVKGADGCVTFSWPAFNGVDFNYWKLVHGDWGTEPYYPDFPYWAALDPSVHSFKKCGIPAGEYAVRVQAIYYPRGSAYAAAQSNVYHLTIAPSAATPAPAPQSLSLTKSVEADGVHLHWSQYTGAGFQYYKVVRSETNTNPMYPENSGTTLVAAIDAQGTLNWTDPLCAAGTATFRGGATISTACGLQSGHTYYYRVIAYTFEGNVVLGKSNVATVAIP